MGVEIMGDLRSVEFQPRMFKHFKVMWRILDSNDVFR